MKEILGDIFLILGKKVFGKMYKKIIILMIILVAYIAMGIVLKITWKKFKKNYIPFLK